MFHGREGFLAVSNLAAEVEHVVALRGKMAVVGLGARTEFSVVAGLLRSPCHFRQSYHAGIEHVFGVFVGGNVFGEHCGLETHDVGACCGVKRVGSRIEGIDLFKGKVASCCLGLGLGSVLIAVEVAECARSHHGFVALTGSLGATLNTTP